MGTITVTGNQQKVLAQLHSTLAHAVTEYDRKQSTRKGYNRYAIGHYLGAVQSICAELAHHPDKLTRAVIVDHFNGPLLDACLRACGFSASTKAEQMETL